VKWENDLRVFDPLLWAKRPGFRALLRQQWPSWTFI